LERWFLLFEDKIKTNSDIRAAQHYKYKDLWFDKGELFGWFEMGSTILLFFEKGVFRPNLEVNQKVKFGEPIGEKI